MTDFPARGQKAPAYWDTQLKAYIDEADATKADAASTTTSLGTKASVTYVDGAVAPKANTTDVNTQLAAKADAAATTTALAGKEPTQTAATQAEAEAGTDTNIRKWSPLRIKQAIVALGTSGTVGGNVQWIQQNSDGSWPAPATTSASVLMFWRGIVGGTAPGDGTTRATGTMLRGVDVWIRVP